MEKEKKGITLGQAAKTYGVVKMTLMRWADQGKVVTLSMPSKHGQARLLDEQSLDDFMEDRGVVDKVARREVVKKGELSLAARETAREYMKHCKNVGYSRSAYNNAERVIMGFAQKYEYLPFSGSDVQGYINEKDISQHSKKLYFGMIRTFYNWVERQYDISTPIKHGMAPKVKRQMPRALQEDEIKAVLGVIGDHQDKVMINTFLATGIRRGELCNLDKGDVYPANIHIKSVEGNKTGEGNVPIPEWLYEQLKGLGGDGVHVFSGSDGKRITKDTVSQRVIRMMKKAGIEGRRRGAHTLRHTAACNLLEATGDLDFERQI